MNYLGHLYLSGDNHELMLANLFGDFVKGKDYTYLPQIIQDGVGLHRQIDDFVDRHPLVSELRLKLYKELPKIAGIAIDLFFDHLLAKHWSKYHPKPLNQYVDRFFYFVKDRIEQKHHPHPFEFPDQFIQLINVMHKQNWLIQYQNIDGLVMASTGLSKRISFPNNLNEADIVFIEYIEEIEHVFNIYILDAKNRFNIHY